ncbi:trypsin-like peptidase domain-containing protein [Candidatus Jorgensenbacteria bacterium]|nr:trypsin-like peptidase domain-containing protein [Candidatus Jorgensenbacteria bacterium]
MPKEKSEVIQTIKKVMPTVVSVIISKSLEEVKKDIGNLEKEEGIPTEPLVIPPEKIDAHGMVQVGGGSGFIVDESGIVLTNKHVIAEPNSSYTVITNDDMRYNAEVLARDPVNDVAILKIKPTKKLPAIELGSSENLELGQTVLAIGNALGIFKNTVSMGIVSGLSRSISAQSEPGASPQEMRGLIQTDAAINPGNSGGPLTDIFGKAVGINAAVVFGAQNISFAIPIKAAERDLADLKKYGRIRRPLIGLRYLIITPDLKEKLKLPVDYGAYVTKEHPADEAVIKDSPADKAGMKDKDIILLWNGKKISIEKNVLDYMDDCNVGEIVTLKILRGKEELDAKVTLTERK